MKLESFNYDDPLAPAPGEAVKAWRALNDYALLGPGRSLDKLLAMYAIKTKAGELVATKNRTTLAGWSTRHLWQKRIVRFEEIEASRRLETFRHDDDAIADMRRELAADALELAVRAQRRVLANARNFENVPDPRTQLQALGTFIKAALELSRIEHAGKDPNEINVNMTHKSDDALIAALRESVMARAGEGVAEAVVEVEKGDE